MHLVQIISKNSKNMHKVAYKVCLIFGWEGCLCLKMIHEGLFTGKGGCQITKTRGWHDSMRLALVEVVEACLDYSKNFWAIPVVNLVSCLPRALVLCTTRPQVSHSFQQRLEKSCNFSKLCAPSSSLMHLTCTCHVNVGAQPPDCSTVILQHRLTIHPYELYLGTCQSNLMIAPPQAYHTCWALHLAQSPSESRLRALLACSATFLPQWCQSPLAPTSPFHLLVGQSILLAFSRNNQHNWPA